MIQITKSALPAALLSIPVLLVLPALAQADDTYSNDFRLGLYSVFYHTSADNLQGPLIPAGEDLNLKADNLSTLYIGYIRRLSPHFAAELALAIPPVAKTEGVGPASVGSVPYAGQVISTARWIAPTAFIEYNFFDEGTKFRPFIGVGINYTTFYDRDSTAAGNAASGGPTRLSLTSSVGPAATAGFTYRIAPHWDATASYSIARVNSNLEADTAGLIRTTSIKFGPQALILSVGYSF
jgi:outer membrane protein